MTNTFLSDQKELEVDPLPLERSCWEISRTSLRSQFQGKIRSKIKSQVEAKSLFSDTRKLSIIGKLSSFDFGGEVLEANSGQTLTIEVRSKVVPGREFVMEGTGTVVIFGNGKH